MSHTAGAVETSDTSSPAGALPDIRLRGLTKRGAYRLTRDEAVAAAPAA